MMIALQCQGMKDWYEKTIPTQVLDWDDVILNDLTCDDMFFHDAASGFGVHFAVSDFGGFTNDDLNDGLFFALANTASLSNDYSGQALGFDIIQDGFHGVAGAGGNATRAHANDHLGFPIGSLHFAFFERFFAQAFKIIKAFYGRHNFSPVLIRLYEF
jgi:hypothetical protein